MRLDPFDSEIQRILNLSNDRDYGFIIDSYYLFEDTEAAKSFVRANGLCPPGIRDDIGLVYLKFYGVMNACYLQHEAIVVCARKLGLHIDKDVLSSNSLIVHRNDFAAHSPNRGRGDEAHSFILDRFRLRAGEVAGYSSNAPGGIKFRDAKIDDLLNDWDTTFLPVLERVSEAIVARVLAAGIREA
jgi:hypothetical protein